MNLKAHQTAIILGVIIGVVVRFYKTGSTTGDKTPFNGH